MDIKEQCQQKISFFTLILTAVQIFSTPASLLRCLLPWIFMLTSSGRCNSAPRRRHIAASALWVMCLLLLTPPGFCRLAWSFFGCISRSVVSEWLSTVKSVYSWSILYSLCPCSCLPRFACRSGSECEIKRQRVRAPNVFVQNTPIRDCLSFFFLFFL
jgi:hypothetical protein